MKQSHTHLSPSLSAAHEIKRMQRGELLERRGERFDAVGADVVFTVESGTRRVSGP